MEFLESPMFWILGGGGTLCIVAGMIFGKQLGFGSLPLWNYAVLIVGILVASAFFASQE